LSSFSRTLKRGRYSLIRLFSRRSDCASLGTTIVSTSAINRCSSWFRALVRKSVAK
jgi:hypothetical protein